MTPRAGTATRERLSRDTIVAGALELADREGLDAVTIRRLATDNGVTPMALYWHFTDKDAVLDGIAEHIYASVRVPEPSGAPWADELRAVLDAMLAAIRPHPLVADLLAPRVMSSEAALVLAERVIGLLRRGGFSASEAAQTGSLLLCSIVVLVTSEPGSKNIADENLEAHLRAKRAGLDALDPKRFPHLLESAEFFVDCTDETGYYELGMDFLVKGTIGILPA
jgi:TetR/AcrR family transcriptional regulator, tetracycline repressor protein